MTDLSTLPTAPAISRQDRLDALHALTSKLSLFEFWGESGKPPIACSSVSSPGRITGSIATSNLPLAGR